MAYCTVPISWSGSGKKYIGTLDFTQTEGNSVSGRWGTLTGTCNTKSASVEYWRFLDVTGVLTQGEKIKSVDYSREGAFYPNSSYPFTLTFSEALVDGPYTIEVQENFNILQSMTLPNMIGIDVTSVTSEKPFNFSKIGDKIYEDVVVRFNLLSSNRVDYQVLQNDVEIMKADNVATKQITIPKGTLKSKDSVVLKVRSRFVFGGQTYFSDWVSYSVSGLQELRAPEVENLRYVGVSKNIEEPMLVAWENLNVIPGSNTRYTLELWQDGYLKHTSTNVGTQYNIPANTLLSTNTATVKVYNTSTYLGYSSTSSVKTISLSGMTSIKPQITDFTLLSNNADYDITVEPTCKGATQYEVIYGSKKVSGLLIPKDTLVKGNIVLTLVAIAVSAQGNRIESRMEKSFDIVWDEPTIYSLEPSGLNMDTQKPILISFVTSDFVDRWELTLPNAVIINGTTERQYLCPPKIFGKGENRVTVKTYYRCGRSDTRSSLFTGYGLPAQPILNVNEVYATALPVFTWTTVIESDSDRQTAYKIKITDASTGLRVEEKQEESDLKRFISTVALYDDKAYRVELSIKNKYGQWSEKVVRGFVTQFTDLPVPVLNLYNYGESVFIEINTENTPEDFLECKVYRREDGGDWVELGNMYDSIDTLTDYTARPKVLIEYKCRLFNMQGAFSESDSVSTSIDIDTFNLFDIEDVDSGNIRLDYVKPTYSPQTDRKQKLFAGAEKPIVFGGKPRYTTAQLVVTCEDDVLENLTRILNTGRVFCYRTWKGKKMYVSASISGITPINRAFNNVNLVLTEINFKEHLIYAGKGKRKLVYMNGEFFMDGSIDMSGITTTKGADSVGRI